MERTPDPECWLHAEVVVAPSSVAGRGLVAAAPLGAGTVVSRLGGRLVSPAGLLALQEGDGRVDWLEVDEDLFLVLPQDAPNRYANHSCDPNLGWAGEYTLVAVRDVAAGEELTHDYSTSIADPEFVLRCHCESTRCRQMVAGDDWLISALQKRYAGYWTPFLRRRIDDASTTPGRAF